MTIEQADARKKAALESIGREFVEVMRNGRAGDDNPHLRGLQDAWRAAAAIARMGLGYSLPGRPN